MDQKVRGGDLVIATAAVRSEGTSYEYIPPGYPAAADFTVVSALKKAAESLSQNQGGKQYHVGVIQSKDSFYGETDPNSMPVGQRLSENWSAYLKCGCLASEMEAAAIFSVAAVRKARAGCVLTAIWNVERSNAGLDDSVCMSNERAIKCAVYAIKELIKKDGR